MAAAIVVDSVSRKASIISSRKASIISSLAPDAGPFDVRYVKSGSFDFGQANEGSVYIVSVGDGSVNPGFVEDKSDEDVSSDCGLPRTERSFDGQPSTNRNTDKISVMVIGSFEEPVVGCPFTAQRTESGETQLESISAGQNKQDKTQTSPEKMTPVDVSKESDTYKLSMRDYLRALSIFIITFITYGNVGALAVLAVAWQHEFKNSKSLILYVSNLAYAMMSATGVVDGLLINRFGIFNIILLGCFLQITCVIGSSFSTNAITLVIVLGFLLGLATCFTYLNSFILMGLQFGDAGKSFIAALSIAGPLSGLVFPNLIPVFIEQYTWRGGMFLLAGIDLQMIPLALFLLLSQKYKKKKQRKDDARTKRETTDPISLPVPKKTFDVSVLKDPLYVAYVCAVAATMSGVNIMESLLPSFLHHKGLVMKEAAALFGIYSVVSAVPRVLIGLIQRWVNIRFIYIFIGSVSIFGLMYILINQAESYFALCVACIILGLCMGGPTGLYSIGILECVGPEKYSSAMSINDTTYGVVTAVFGYLAGLLVEHMDSYQLAFCIYGAFIITTNLCLLITSLVQYWRAKNAFHNSEKKNKPSSSFLNKQ